MLMHVLLFIVLLQLIENFYVFYIEYYYEFIACVFIGIILNWYFALLLHVLICIMIFMICIDWIYFTIYWYAYVNLCKLFNNCVLINWYICLNYICDICMIIDMLYMWLFMIFIL